MNIRYLFWQQLWFTFLIAYAFEWLRSLSHPWMTLWITAPPKHIIEGILRFEFSNLSFLSLMVLYPGLIFLYDYIFAKYISVPFWIRLPLNIACFHLITVAAWWLIIIHEFTA